MSTETTAGARAHARAQGSIRVEAMPTMPPTAATDLPDGVDPASVVWDEVVAGGGSTSLVVGAGTTLRFTDLRGDAAAHLVVLRADQPVERLCVADTVKVLWQAYLGDGHLLLSDQGRVLASFVGDGSGHHDALAGTSNRAGNQARYGDGSIHGPSPAGRELLVVLAAKHGLTGRDLPPSVTLLKGTRVEPDGSFAWRGGSGPRGWVELKAELPLIVLVANVPHVLDPRPGYATSPLRLTAWTGRPTSPQDARWTSSPEAERAFSNTDLDARARGLR